MLPWALIVKVHLLHQSNNSFFTGADTLIPQLKTYLFRAKSSATILKGPCNFGTQKLFLLLVFRFFLGGSSVII